MVTPLADGLVTRKLRDWGLVKPNHQLRSLASFWIGDWDSNWGFGLGLGIRPNWRLGLGIGIRIGFSRRIGIRRLSLRAGFGPALRSGSIKYKGFVIPIWFGSQRMLTPHPSDEVGIQIPIWTGKL